MSEQPRRVNIIERMSTRLKFKQIRLLVAIAEHSSILRAANAVSISQPAATKLLKDIEEDLDVLLFNRTNRGVVPTEHGTALVKHGKLIIAQISHAAQELDDLNEGLGGRIVVGTLLAASARLLPRVIKNIHEQRPNVSIVIRDGTNDLLMPLLHTGELDMIVGRLAQYRYREKITQEILFHEDVVIACRKQHPLTSKKSISFKDLHHSDWILPPTQTTLRRQIDQVFFDHGYASPPNSVESISFLTNRSILLETDMIGIFPFDVVQNEVTNGDLTIIQFDLNIDKSPVGVAYRSAEALSPAASAFLLELRDIASTINDK